MYVLTPDGVRLRIFGATAARLNCARVFVCVCTCAYAQVPYGYI